MAGALDLAAIEAALRLAGLTPRGAFRPAPGDGVPPLPDGRAAATVVLAGNAGPAMWRRFAIERRAADAPNALDGWTRGVLRGLAERLGGHPLYPFGGPPYLPFQRWARRAEPVHPSPIGPLIHPDYGLWHAYRGALAFADALDPPPADDRPSPCESCADKPCLKTCPVGALTHDGGALTHDGGALTRWAATTCPPAPPTSPRPKAPTAWASRAARGAPARSGAITRTAPNSPASTWTPSWRRGGPRNSPNVPIR